MKSSEFAKLLGISVATLNEMVRDEVLIPVGRNNWELSSVTNYCEILRAKNRSQAAELRRATEARAQSPKSKDTNEEYRKQKTRITKFQADQMAGELCKIQAVESFITNMVMRCNARLNGLGDAVATVVRPLLANGRSAAEIKKLVDTKVREAQSELSEHYEAESRFIGQDTQGTGEEDR